MTIDDPFLDREHQLVVRDRLETRSDVRLDDPSPPSPGLIDQDLQSVVCAPFGSEPERARQEVGLEHWLDDDLHCRLHNPVADRRDRQRALLGRAGFGNPHPAGRQRPIRLCPKIGGQLVEQPGHPVLLDVGDGGSVDARCAAVAAHLNPGALQHVPAMDLVIERVEPSSGVGLGRPVKRPLQDLDLVCCGGTSHEGTHRTLPCAEAHRRSRGPSLTGGCVVRPAQAVLRPPPTPTRHDTHFPAQTGYRTRRSGGTRRPPGRGGPPQFPSLTF